MEKLLKNILNICMRLSSVPLLLLLGIAFLDVIARYAFNASINSALEMCEMFLSMLISLGLGYVNMNGENFSLVLVVERVPAHAKRVLSAVTWFINAALCYILAIQAISKAIYSLRIGEITGNIEMPVYPAKFLFAFGLLLAALAATANFLSIFRGRMAVAGAELNL